jgi:hypothetical protein
MDVPSPNILVPNLLHCVFNDNFDISSKTFNTNIWRKCFVHWEEGWDALRQSQCYKAFKVCVSNATEHFIYMNFAGSQTYQQKFTFSGCSFVN